MPSVRSRLATPAAGAGAFLLLCSCASGGPADAASGAEAGGGTVSLLEAFFIQHNQRTGDIEWLGSLIVWGLLAGSLASWALIIALIRSNRRAEIVPPEEVEQTRALLRDGKVAEVARLADESGSHFGAVMRDTLREVEQGYDAMSRALERAGEEHTAQRLRRIETLNVIGAIAPMVGLFGTVYGMILAFQEIVASGGSPDPVDLAAGIGTALTTTFWGLVVAIPALAVYAMVRNTIDALTAEAALAAEETLRPFKENGDDDAARSMSSERSVVV